jgi:putative Mg2+ transporter-C (MgtC) family protein
MTLLDFAGRLGLALLCGALIGLERQWRQRMAGLRTNTLVTVGAALFVLAAGLTTKSSAPSNIPAQVVSGIGFLGAGVILRDGLSVRGLNTAATLWCAAGVGMLAGFGLPLEALLGTLAVLIANLVLRPLARRIDRQPGVPEETPSLYRVNVVCRADQEAHVRSLLLYAVGGSGLALRRLQSQDSANPAQIEVRADLVGQGNQDAAVEQAVARLSLEPGVSAVGWEVVADPDAVDLFAAPGVAP